MKQAIQGVASKPALMVTAALLKFICFGDPQDGDVLLYLPFDGDMDTVASVSENAGGEISYGTPAYDSDVVNLYVVEHGDPTALARTGANQGCLYANKARVKKTITHPFMLSDSFTAATIEFIMKGSSNDADVTTWGDKLSLGNANSKCGLMVQADDSKKYYLRVDTESANATTTSSFAMTDGKWHHFAITIEPTYDGAQTKVVFYIDYVKVYEKTVSGRWCGLKNYAGCSFGQSSNVVWIDEFRVTKGAISPDKFLYLAAKPDPQDGDSLLYIPFDGSMDSIVSNLYWDYGESMSGTPTYDSAVWNLRVVECGNPNVRARKGDNQACIKCDKMRISKTILNPFMANSNFFGSATVEFFIKGSDNDNDVTTWKNKLSFGSDGSKYGLIVQADDNKKYYLRVDTDAATGKYAVSATSPFAITDGRWHHFAITIEPVENGTMTKASFYFDYGDPVVETTSGSWRGLRYGNGFTFGETTSVLWFDELRISKGVLPKTKFMKAKSADGLTLFIR